MSQVQVEQKNYRMPPQDGFTIAHFLTVSDIERSARFYETVFGGRILSGGDSSGAPGYIRVADIQACYDLWRSRGAEFITEPKDKYGEIRCYIRDPDGYIIEVGQSKPGVAYG
jgi:predicted enzyme related to lactoylglutathione lyase